MIRKQTPQEGRGISKVFGFTPVWYCPPQKEPLTGFFLVLRDLCLTIGLNQLVTLYLPNQTGVTPLCRRGRQVPSLSRLHLLNYRGYTGEMMGDVLVAVRQTLANEEIVNVLGFSNVSEDEDELQDLADEIRESWANELATNLSIDWQLDDIKVSFIDNDHISHSTIITPSLGPLEGLDPGDILPTQSCLLTTFSYAGVKPNRGRSYLAGYTEAGTLDGVWLGGLRVGATQHYQGMVDGLNIGNTVAFLRIVGRPNDTRPNYVTNPITSIGTHGPVRTQRRRSL